MIRAILEEIERQNIMEGKNLGPLYHYTTLDAFWKIIDQDALLASKEGEVIKGSFVEEYPYFVSLSRSKNFNAETSFGCEIGFQLDGSAISDKYKIEAFNYYGATDNNPDYKRDLDYDEREERVLFKKKYSGIKPFLKYVQKIIILDPECKGAIKTDSTCKDLNVRSLENLVVAIERMLNLPVEIY